MTKMGMQEGEVISHPWVSKAIERSQKAVEGHNFDIRKHLLEYDDVMNKQRERIYKERNRVLRERDIRSHMLQIVEDVAADGVETYLPEKGGSDEWDIEGLKKWYMGIFQQALEWKMDNLRRDGPAKPSSGRLPGGDGQGLREKGRPVRPRDHAHPGTGHPVGGHRQPVERPFAFHGPLEGGHRPPILRRKGPLIEYKREGLEMFLDMLGRIEEETLRTIFLVQTVKAPEQFFANAKPVFL